MVGSADGGVPLLAESLAWGSATEELLDRWRSPGAASSKVWEERFGETRYVELGVQAWDSALDEAGLVADQVDRVIVAGPHRRSCAALARKLAVGERLADDLSGSVGQTGAAHPLLLLSAELESARSGQVIAVVSLADGADVWLLRITDAITDWRPAAIRCRAARNRIADRLRHLPCMARLPAGRATASSRACPRVGQRGQPLARLEVRLRRFG